MRRVLSIRRTCPPEMPRPSGRILLTRAQFHDLTRRRQRPICQGPETSCRSPSLPPVRAGLRGAWPMWGRARGGGDDGMVAVSMTGCGADGERQDTRDPWYPASWRRGTAIRVFGEGHDGGGEGGCPGTSSTRPRSARVCLRWSRMIRRMAGAVQPGRRSPRPARGDGCLSWHIIHLIAIRKGCPWWKLSDRCRMASVDGRPPVHRRRE